MLQVHILRRLRIAAILAFVVVFAGAEARLRDLCGLHVNDLTCGAGGSYPSNQRSHVVMASLSSCSVVMSWSVTGWSGSRSHISSTAVVKRVSLTLAGV